MRQTAWARSLQVGVRSIIDMAWISSFAVGVSGRASGIPAAAQD
jgi:hypothetical protein